MNEVEVERERAREREEEEEEPALFALNPSQLVAFLEKENLQLLVNSYREGPHLAASGRLVTVDMRRGVYARLHKTHVEVFLPAPK